MIKLFEINGVDYTKYINDRKYIMRRNELFQEWRDGNFNIRRVHERFQIKGSFIASFFTVAEYDAFVAAIKTATDVDGWCTVSVFVEDDKSFTTINAFVDLKPSISWTNKAAGSLPALANVEVSIIER